MKKTDEIPFLDSSHFIEEAFIVKNVILLSCIRFKTLNFSIQTYSHFFQTSRLHKKGFWKAT